MKHITLFVLSLVCCSYCFGQNNNTIIRHDTTLLKAEECQWFLHKADADEQSGGTISAVIINAIVAGKLKAIDYNTGEKIPAGKFLTWHQPADTMMVFDEKLQKDAIRVVQRTLNPERITRIRINHDWMLDNSSGKIQTVLTRVVLMIDILSPDGTVRGITPFCRVE